MPFFKKKPIVVECHQWLKNGDHPEDASHLITPVPGDGESFLSEGELVRRFKHPNRSGNDLCEHCSKTMHVHGWMDTLEGDHIVCPGDWIITGVKGEHYPCKNDIFEMTYEAVEQTP